MRLQKYINEKINKTVNPALIDPDKVEDAGSMIDLKDMARFDNFDPSKYYAVEKQVFRVSKDGDIIPIKGVEANFNWSTGKFIMGTPKWEVPPKNLKIGKTLINPETNAPYVFYHGTKADFKKFSDKFAGSKFGSMNTINGGFMAHYFTTNKERAEVFGKNIHRVVVKLRNKILHIKDLNKMQNEWINDSKAIEKNELGYHDIKIPYMDWLLSKGYNMYGYPLKTSGWEEIAVFRAKDIIEI